MTLMTSVTLILLKGGHFEFVRYLDVWDQAEISGLFTEKVLSTDSSELFLQLQELVLEFVHFLVHS